MDAETQTLPYYEARNYLQKRGILTAEKEVIIATKLSADKARRVRKHYFVTLMRDKRILGAFFKKHWQRGLSAEGKSTLALYERVHNENQALLDRERMGGTRLRPFDAIAKELYEEIEASLLLSGVARKKRLKTASKIPKKVLVVSHAYIRNADVIAEVLYRAHGMCEECKERAPFVRASNGMPYLEVHHNIPLAAGGEDTVENAIALCPNCHRRLHYGSE